MKNSEKFNKKLLVEGNDDRHVIWALCKKFKVEDSFDVIDSNGYETLLQELELRLKQSGLTRLGIVIDADMDIKQRWENIKTLLKSKNIFLPENLPDNGLVHKNENGIIIGVWIMPNNNISGMLEDFIEFLIPNDDALAPIIKTNLDEIESAGLNKYKKNHRSKAFIHSWLAVQEESGTPLGLSVTKKYLSSDEKLCLNFIDWINRLFI